MFTMVMARAFTTTNPSFWRRARARETTSRTEPMRVAIS